MLHVCQWVCVYKFVNLFVCVGVCGCMRVCVFARVSVHVCVRLYVCVCGHYGCVCAFGWFVFLSLFVQACRCVLVFVSVCPSFTLLRWQIVLPGRYSASLTN